jgi:hypothetical protein
MNISSFFCILIDKVTAVASSAEKSQACKRRFAVSRETNCIALRLSMKLSKGKFYGRRSNNMAPISAYVDLLNYDSLPHETVAPKTGTILREKISCCALSSLEEKITVLSISSSIVGFDHHTRRRGTTQHRPHLAK